MLFDERPSPARVTAAAAGKLPRWALWGLLIAYLAPGLLGREVWLNEEASGFGLMWTMAHGQPLDWWLPNIFGEPLPEEGPLPFWLGALFIRLFEGLIGAPAAARLSLAVWFALACTALWYTTYRLARRPAAQPVAFAFGGEAEPRDYGRMLGDIALLLMIATFGVVVRLHEATAETALFAAVAGALYGAVWSLDRPLSGAAVAGLAIAMAALSRGALPALTVLAAVLATFALSPGQRVLRGVTTIGIGGALFALWPLGATLVGGPAARTWFDAWWAWALPADALMARESIGWVARTVGWYTWPLWPLAGWALYSWRHSLREPHLRVPLLFVGGAVLLWLFTHTVNESQFIVVVPPLVVLAVFGASTLRRGAENVIDWFSIVLFTFVLAVVWLYIIAWFTGAPPRMAVSITRLAGGAAPTVSALALGSALLATAGWLALITWRVRERPPMLWRGPAIAAAGITVLWTVLVSLSTPVWDRNRSFAQLGRDAAAAAAQVDSDSCIRTYRVAPPTRAMLGYEGRLPLVWPGEECRLLLARDSARSALDDDLPPGEWTLVWQDAAPTRPDEIFRLWVRPEAP